MRYVKRSLSGAELARRHFLLGTMATGALGAAGGLPGIVREAGASVPALNRNILASMFLNGGPDHRHLFMPAYTSGANTYGRLFWEARARLQLRNTPAGMTLQQRYNDAYLDREDRLSGTRFGIFAGAEWLAEMYDVGNVAIVSNIFCDDSRDHENAIRSIELGNTEATKSTHGSGWGGRVAHAAGGRVVALTRSVRTFCYGPHPADPTNTFRWSDAEIVPAPDLRDMQPYYPESDQGLGAGQQVALGLRSYYEAKRADLPANSPYTRFLDQERKLREFGQMLDIRFEQAPMPAALKALGDTAAGYQGPVDRRLAQQMRNMYDAIASYDLTDMRVASLEYNGWDTHDNQAEELDHRLGALYGRGQALETLWNSLDDTARSRFVLVVCGEFGRQINDNGGFGTDHGYGNDVIVIGEPVRGGIYGDKFPDSDFDKFGVRNTQTAGLTAIDHMFGALSDWVAPGSAAQVFPRLPTALKEDGLDLTRLLS